MTMADFDEVMAGSGARLVADQNMARAILHERVRRSKLRRRADQEPQVGSGSRPDATPVPVPSKPAVAPAGALSRKPETHRG